MKDWLIIGDAAYKFRDAQKIAILKHDDNYEKYCSEYYSVNAIYYEPTEKHMQLAVCDTLDNARKFLRAFVNELNEEPKFCAKVKGDMEEIL